MRNTRILFWRQLIVGSLIAFGLVLALANIDQAQIAKADETPPLDWRPANDVVNRTHQPPKIRTFLQ